MASLLEEEEEGGVAKAFLPLQCESLYLSIVCARPHFTGEAISLYEEGDSQRGDYSCIWPVNRTLSLSSIDLLILRGSVCLFGKDICSLSLFLVRGCGCIYLSFIASFPFCRR